MIGSVPWVEAWLFLCDADAVNHSTLIFIHLSVARRIGKLIVFPFAHGIGGCTLHWIICLYIGLQLFSILKGEMSFVGPRPALFSQNDLVALRTAQGVDKLKPGLTGWAQVNGRDELPITEKIEFDVEYMVRQSFWFDMYILWLTVLKVLRRDGITHWQKSFYHKRHYKTHEQKKLCRGTISHAKSQRNSFVIITGLTGIFQTIILSKNIQKHTKIISLFPTSCSSLSTTNLI